MKKYHDPLRDTLMLTSHGKPFIGLHAHVTELQDRHVARLAKLNGIPHAAVRCDIMPFMFKRALNAHRLRFALDEALTHLHYL